MKAKKILLLLNCLIYLFILPEAGPAAAAPPGVELKLVSPEEIMLEPGRPLTLSLLVINHSRTAFTFSEKLELPPDWQVIIPASSFRLAPYDQQVRLVSLFIPPNSPAGSYRIGYSLASREQQSDSLHTAVKIRVAPVNAVDSLCEEQPQVVAAGEDYTVKLRYINKGNTPVTLCFAEKNTPVYPVKFFPAEMTLSPGASQVLTVHIKTRPDGREAAAIRHVLHISAVDKETLLPLANNTFVTDVFPVIAGNHDRYHRVPGRFRIITGGLQQGGDDPGTPGLQLEFSGAGSIDEQGKNQVYLSFLTPNLLGGNFHESPPNFELEFNNNLLNLSAGGRTMALSTLTKRWYGYDNIRLQINLNRHSLGVINPGRNEQGIYYGYQFNERLRMQANYLSRPPAGGGPGNGLYSLQAEFRPLYHGHPRASSVFNLEYALDQKLQPSSAAYRLSWQGYGKDFRYSLGKTMASSTFSGTYNDLESANGMFSFSLCNTLQGSFFYNKYRNNLNLDPSKPVARDEETYLTNFAFRFTPQTTVLFSVRTRQKRDLLLPAQYDYRDSLTKFGWQQQFSHWRLQAFAGAGFYYDRLAAGKGAASSGGVDYKTYALSGTYTPNLRQTYLFFINTGDQNYARISESRSAAGFKASLRLPNNLRLLEDFTLNLEYQKRNLLDPISSGNDYFSLNLAGTYNRLSLTLKASHLVMKHYTLTRLAFFTTYMFPYNIPTVRRKETGAIEGQIFDGSTPAAVPLPNVIVRTNGISVVTNEEGRFVFSSLTPGIYSISIDQSRAASPLLF